MKTSRIIASALVAVSLAGIAPASAQAPVSAPTLALAPHAGAEYLRPVALMSWADKLVAQAGIVRPAGLQILLTNTWNCGADISPVGMGGCTHYTPEGPVVTVSPELENYPAVGAHIVFHEVGHALGIKDECLAEYYAHEYDGAPDVWSYPACQR